MWRTAWRLCWRRYWVEGWWLRFLPKGTRKPLARPCLECRSVETASSSPERIFHHVIKSRFDTFAVKCRCDECSYLEKIRGAGAHLDRGQAPIEGKHFQYGAPCPVASRCLSHLRSRFLHLSLSRTVEPQAGAGMCAAARQTLEPATHYLNTLSKTGPVLQRARLAQYRSFDLRFLTLHPTC